jgi:hypothetical protein
MEVLLLNFCLHLFSPLACYIFRQLIVLGWLDFLIFQFTNYVLHYTVSFFTLSHLFSCRLLVNMSGIIRRSSSTCGMKVSTSYG